MNVRGAMSALTLLLASTAIPTCGAEVAVPPEKAEQWDRFEFEVTNAAEYRDPYRDVTLEVIWTRPDGSKLEFWGFFDGRQTWRARVMPDQIGRWQYQSRFSDGKPGAAGQFECVASDLPGLVSADVENPVWFGYRSGRHGLIRALHVGDRFFAANWPAEKRAAFLEWAGKQGYNTLSIASHLLNRDAPGRGRGWDTPKLWPLDAGEYRRMEAVLDDLARWRMIVFPFAGFFGQASNYPRDPKDQEAYLRYSLARLGPYWNLHWNVAGPEPNLKRSWMAADDVERLGRQIRRLDPFGHLISVHNRTGDDPYRNSDWTSYGVLQGPKTLDPSKLARGLLESHHPRKPLLAQETLWSGNKNHPDYSDDELRKNAYVLQMSAAALVFADNDGDSSTGFSGTLELPDRRQERHDIIRRVWDFIETVPFYRMKPRPDLVNRGFCLADEGREYLVYLPSAAEVQVQLKPGLYALQWFDARQPQKPRQTAVITAGQALSPPDRGDDWLLRLVRQKGG